MSPLLDIQETAEYFGFSTQWVIEQIRSKGLPAYRVGNAWKFIPADLEIWVRKHPNKIRAVSGKHLYNVRRLKSKRSKRMAVASVRLKTY